MKVIIDARWIKSLEFDGIATFTLNIIKQLVKNKSENYYIITQNNELETYLRNNMASTNIINIGCSITSIKNIFAINKILKQVEPDIYFSPCLPFFSPFIIKCKHIAVIHDLIPLIFPEMFSNSNWKFKLFYTNKYIQSYLLSKLAKLITVSQNTKKDLVNILNINPSKIKVISEGVDLPVFDEEIEANIKKKYKLNFSYFLYVGRHESYKNIDTLIKVYTKLSEMVKNKYKLLIIGKFNDNTQNLINLAKELKEEKNIYFLNSIKTNEIGYFYKNAKILLHLSLYEGFGLTLIEAMNYKIPIIASNTSSIPEVLGDSGILVNPNNYNEITENINYLLENNEKYQLYAKKGYERSKIFTWDKTAKDLFALFQDI